MKFVSKLTNYRVTLRPAMPANPALGTPSYGGKFVLFSGGIAIINDDETIEEMKKCKDFNKDFFMFEDSAADPFEGKRPEIERPHVVQEIGGKAMGGAKSVEMISKDDAIKMAKEMAKEIISASLPDIISKIKEDVQVEAAGKKKTKKIKKAETATLEQPTEEAENLSEEAK